MRTMCSDESRRYYLDMIEDDVREWINENIDLDEYKGNRDDLEEKLNDELFNEDSVTGNASGSYYCNTYKGRRRHCKSLGSACGGSGRIWGQHHCRRNVRQGSRMV